VLKSRNVGNSSALALFVATKQFWEAESSFLPRISSLPQSPPSYEAMHLTFSGSSLPAGLQNLFSGCEKGAANLDWKASELWFKPLLHRVISVVKRRRSRY
jgi:hypothetical protein